MGGAQENGSASSDRCLCFVADADISIWVAYIRQQRTDQSLFSNIFAEVDQMFSLMSLVDVPHDVSCRIHALPQHIRPPVHP